jgi:2-methylcitrate dehydratase
VRELIDKVTIEGDPELDKISPTGISEIVTRQGKRYRLKVDYPKGHPLNPMTDQEIEEKFSSMAERLMSPSQTKAVFDVVWALENVDDIGALIKRLVF